MIHVDIDAPRNKYGYPGEKSKYEDWIKYSRAFTYLDDAVKKEVDLILIDGRFRVACALNLFDQIENDTTIIFDDFLNRKNYHIVLEYYDITMKAGRTVILKKKNIGSPSRELINKYECDPK